MVIERGSLSHFTTAPPGKTRSLPFLSAYSSIGYGARSRSKRGKCCTTAVIRSKLLEFLLMSTEPITDVAHLGHLELLTPKPEESRNFFVNILGMTETGREGDSVYLHAYDDYERHSLKLTASKQAGVGHVAFRACSPQALERRVAALKGSGFDHGWTDGDLAHGPAFVCCDPDGHRIELYYETQWYEAPLELKPALKNQAQKFPGRGVNVRRLDHWNGLAVDIKANREFFQNYLGFRLTEQIVMD